MPQPTLFGAWTIDRMTIDVKLNTNRPGGKLHVQFHSEDGKTAGARSVQWNKDRDLADLGLVLRDVANAFLWAPQLEMLDELQAAFRRWCPEVPPSGQ